MAESEASTSRINCCLGSGWCRMGAWMKDSFNCCNTQSASGVHMKVFLVEVRDFRNSAIFSEMINESVVKVGESDNSL